jgi:hypothetical protein
LSKGEFDAPGEPGLRAGDREVAELLGLQKSQDFIAARGGANELFVLPDVFDQPFLILAHPEKIIVLAQLFDGPFAVRAEAADHIFFRPEPFVVCAVPPSIICLVNQLFVVQLLKIPLNHGLVRCVGGADEGVMGNVQTVARGV